MNVRRIVIPCRRRLRQSRVLQLCFISVFWMLGSGVAALSGWPVPGGIWGLFILLGCLAAGIVRLADVRRGADWFLAEMLLFFIPAMPAVIDHPEFLGSLGFKIALILILGTLSVMLATAFACEACHRFLERRAEATKP